MQPTPEPQPKKPSQQPQIVFLVFALLGIFLIFFIIQKRNSASSVSDAVIDTTISSIDTTANVFLTDSVKGVIYKQIVSDIKKEFRTSYDDMEKNYWVYDKTSSKGIMSSQVSLYLGISKIGVWRRFKVHYFGDDWLFIKAYKFQINGELIEYIPADVNTDNDAGYVWETFDQCPDDNSDLENIITKLANAKTAKVRFIGDQYYKDKVITTKELKAIKHINDLYLETKIKYNQ